MFVQSSLDFLGKACEGRPHLRVKIAVDCVEKGYATHEQVAQFLGIGTKRWQQFYDNFREGDVRRIPEDLKVLVPSRDLRYLTGFTAEQFDILQRALQVPFLVSEGIDEQHPLIKELNVLVVLGVILVGRHDQFQSYKLKLTW